MKLMDIDSDTLGIPDTEYDAVVKMSSSEFQRIVRDLSQLGESVRIEVTKEGVRFGSDGEAANGNVLIKQSDGKIEKVGGSSKGKKVKKEEDAEEEEEEEEGSKKSKKPKVKKEKDDDGDAEMDEDDGGSFKAKSDNEDEEEEAEPEDDEDEDSGKKRKRKSGGDSKAKKAKTTEGKSKSKGKKKDDDEEEVSGAIIQMNQAVNLTFSLKYLINFAKSGTLSNRVQLKMSNDVPLLVRELTYTIVYYLLILTIR